MSFKDKLAQEALNAVSTGYNPTVSPACANFVSAMCRKAGKNIQINYVPNFFSLADAKVISNRITPKRGYIVIFDYTYDAVSPAGIGAEDTMTHVGIVLDDKGSLVHYSNSRGKPVLSNIKDWSVNSYIDLDPQAKTSKDHWAYDSYLALKKLGIVKTPENEVVLTEDITRGEVYKIVSRAIAILQK